MKHTAYRPLSRSGSAGTRSSEGEEERGQGKSGRRGGPPERVRRDHAAAKPGQSRSRPHDTPSFRSTHTHTQTHPQLHAQNPHPLLASGADGLELNILRMEDGGGEMQSERSILEKNKGKKNDIAIFLPDISNKIQRMNMLVRTPHYFPSFLRSVQSLL